jgi:hypothetical protein
VCDVLNQSLESCFSNKTRDKKASQFKKKNPLDIRLTGKIHKMKIKGITLNSVIDLNIIAMILKIVMVEFSNM